MKVSIITVCYNAEKTIEDTIKSVIEQKKTYSNIEYIIVDGASKDKTLDIINKYEKYIDKVISEPDNGIYDAMNKGIKLASGDIIGFLNSDDIYYKSNIIKLIAEVFQEKQTDSIYGDLIYIHPKKKEKVIRYWKAGDFDIKKFEAGWHPPHPTFFVKREIYDKYGLFNTKFKIAADYELMLRFLKRYKISTFYIPKILVKMRAGGVSNKSIKNVLKANYECYLAWKENNLNPPLSLPLKKILSKLTQLKL